MLAGLLLIGAFGCGALILAGYALARAPFVQQRLKSLAATALEQQYGATLEMGEISGNLLSSLTVKNVRLAGPSGTVLIAGRVSIGYRLLPLLNRAVKVTGLRLDGLRLNLVRHPDGQWNVVTLFQSREPAAPTSRAAEPFKVLVEKLSIRSGSLYLQDDSAEPPQARRFDDIDLTVGLKIGQVIEADFRRLAFRLDAPRLIVTRLQGRLAYHTDDGSLAIQGLDLMTEDSRMSLDGRLQFAEPRMQIKANLAVVKLSLTELGRLLAFPSLDRGNVTGDAVFEGSLERLDHRLNLRLDGQTLTAQGVVTLNDELGLGIHTRGHLRRLNPTTWPLKGTSGWSGDVNADFSLDGEHLETTDRRGRLNLQLQPSELAGQRIEKGQIDFSVDAARLTVNQAKLEGPAGSVNLQGRLTGIRKTAEGLAARVSAQIRNLKTDAFLPDKQLGGTINADLTLEAGERVDAERPLDPGNWTCVAKLRLHPSVVLSAPVNSGSLRALWDGKELQVQQLDLDSAAVRLTVQGRTTLKTPSYSITGDVAVDKAAHLAPLLSRLAPGFPVQKLPQGRLRLKGNVRGNAKAADIHASVNVDDLTSDRVKLASARLTADGTYSRTGFNARAKGHLTGIQYQANRFPRLDLQVALTPEAMTVDLNLAAETGERIHLSGQAAPWRAQERRIRIDTLKVVGITGPLARLSPGFANAGPIRLRTSADGVHIEAFKLVWKEGSLQISGNAAIKGPQQLKITLAGLDLHRLSAVWQESPTLKGLVDADIVLGGTAASPVIDARVNVTGAGDDRFSLSDLNFRLRYGDDTASLTAEGVRKGKNILDAEARSGLRLRLWPFEVTPLPGTLQAHLKTENLQLSELPIPLGRSLRTAGELTVGLSATGGLLQPRITGDVTLRKGSLALLKHGVSYESVQADLHLAPDKITIERIQAKGDREGSLNLTGEIRLDRWKPEEFNLHLIGQRAPIAWKRAFTARIDSDVTLSGPLASPVLKGQLTIPEGRVNLDRLAEGGPAEIQVIGETNGDNGQTIVIGEPGQDDTLSSLTADLSIKVPRNVWLKGQQLNSEIAGDIQLKKKARGPFLLFGTLNTVRGSYQFQGHRFTISRGIVEFQGLKEPDPALDIKADTRIRSVKITVGITGSARKIELTLESEPAMDRADIISYLIFGRPTNELRTQQATSTETAALDFAGRVTARELNKILGDALQVDEIRIDPGETGGSAGSLSVGKYVTRNIFVTYRLAFSSQENGEVGIEYELNPNFSIETQLGNEKTSGVDLIWKKEF